MVMKSELRIDDICAAPGAMERGFVTFDESAAGTLVRAPVILINGAQAGPTVVVTSGVHGDDLNTVPMTWRVAALIVIAVGVGHVLARVMVQMQPPAAPESASVETVANELYLEALSDPPVGIADVVMSVSDGDEEVEL